ncbi:MAG TPA: class I SAM-dependent methyltransferase [Egibacteraceae bacterium]|nr:class I SAM-dependent methyltransferase [Egibacteraceae bacterium]
MNQPEPSRAALSVREEGAGERRAPETPGVVIGNHHHKYTSTNPAIRYLTNRFLDRLEAMFDAVAVETPTARVAEIGCGEGEIAERLHGRWGNVTAVDLPDAGLRRQWATRPGPRFLHGDATRLPFADNTFDVLASVEVLEHLDDPVAGLHEYARVARRHLVLSVPREPVFRMGNLIAGRHVRAFGNTPGHLNHWSSPGFIRFVSTVGAVAGVTKPLPWTIVWVRLDGP